MRKGEVINGYEILKDSTPAGGRGEVSFAKKNGKEYFIKVFLAPKYPVDGAPGNPKTLADKRERCNKFEQQQRLLNDRIATKCSIGGNLVYAIDFFRSGTRYYKINEKIDVSSLNAKDVSKLPKDNILIVLKTLTHSLKILHDLEIVHGDLKPDNILIKKTETGSYTSKLIDFDDSYFTGSPSDDVEEIVGTPEYYSPELLEYIKKTGKYAKVDLTTKSDIFALGIIFTEYISGEKPRVNAKYSSVAHFVANDNPVEVKEFSSIMSTLINSMLQKEITKRPDINEVFKTLKAPDISGGIIPKEDELLIKTGTGTIKVSRNLILKGCDLEETSIHPKVTSAIKVSGNLKIS